MESLWEDVFTQRPLRTRVPLDDGAEVLPSKPSLASRTLFYYLSV